MALPPAVADEGIFVEILDPLHDTVMDVSLVVTGASMPAGDCDDPAQDLIATRVIGHGDTFRVEVEFAGAPQTTCLLADGLSARAFTDMRIELAETIPGNGVGGLGIYVEHSALWTVTHASLSSEGGGELWALNDFPPPDPATMYGLDLPIRGPGYDLTGKRFEGSVQFRGSSEIPDGVDDPLLTGVFLPVTYSDAIEGLVILT